MSSDDSEWDDSHRVAEIKWVLENFPQANCFHKEEDIFYSNEFCVTSLDNSLWRLELHLDGHYLDDIVIRRLRDNQDNRTPVTISYELWVEDQHSLSNHQTRESNVTFPSGRTCGCCSLVSLDLNDSTFLDECLPGDVLTIWCYMYSTSIKTDIRITKALLTTHIPCEKISFVWKIKRFLNRKTDPSKTVCFDSPFSLDATASPLQVTVSIIRFLDETYVKIVVEGDSEYFLKCRIWHEKNEEDYLLISKRLSDFPYVESYLPLIKESEILSYPEVYLDNGTLKLNCEVSLVTDDIKCFSQCQSFKTSDQDSVWYNSLRGSTDQNDKSKSPINKN